MSVIDTLKSIKAPFWLANAQEACERLAYFGIRAVLPLMMVSTGTGGLGLSFTQKAVIYGVWAFIQCLVPMVSGGFSESFGYKKSLIVAFIINTLGYLMMANILPLGSLLGFQDSVGFNFAMMFISGCTIGLGTAIFKPPVQGIVAKSLDEKTSGFGFGLFYWVVNVGGLLAPMIATSLRGNDAAPTWNYVFYGAAFVTLFNLIITIFFFKEPVRTEEEIAKHKNESAGQVFLNTLKTLWNDKNMLMFLLIVSGFWLMFMQLWDLLPNFIDEWVDRRGVGAFLQQIPGIRSMSWYEADGSLKPEMIINIDSAVIILFVLPLSALFARYKMMTALVLGMVISVIGFILGGVTMSGGLCCLAIFIFAIGEVICSPKFSEYIGMTAPADKKAIYMGYSNIPFAIGWAVGNFLSGPLYDAFSSKLKIGHAWLANHGVTSISASDLDLASARKLLTSEQGGMTPEQIAELIQKDGMTADAQKETLLKLIQDKNITDIPLDYCNMDCVLNHVQTIENVSDSYAATEVLWNSSTPWVIWLILGSIGIASMAGMIAFYFKSGMAAQDNAGNTTEDNKESAEEKSVDNEEKSVDNEEKSVDNEEKSVDNEEKSEDSEEKSEDSEEKSEDSEEKSED